MTGQPKVSVIMGFSIEKRPLGKLSRLSNDVCESHESIKCRMMQKRMNNFRTLAWGNSILGFPKSQLINPAILSLKKCKIPFSAIRWSRQRQGYLGGHI